MESDEVEVRVPFSNPEGDTEYATIIVQVRPDMTLNDIRVEVADAITEFIQSRQSQSDRLQGFEVEYNNIGEYEYEIVTPH